jgi:2'-5' RNA ligase
VTDASGPVNKRQREDREPSDVAELWRVFIALELPPPLKRALADVRHRLPAGPARAVRWIPPDGIHLTLRFLGDTDPARVQAIASGLAAAAGQSGRFWLELGMPGTFPPAGAPRVFWIGLRGELKRLASLQGRVEGSLAASGFEPDRRPFHPHLTVGRIGARARTREALDARAAFLRLPVEPGQRFEAKTVTLWRSHLREDGAVYEELASAQLV